VLLNNATGAAVEYSREEKRLFGEIMIDLDSIEKPGPGRPVGTGDNRVITFRLKLTLEERAKLDELAEAAGQTPSQLVRDRIFGPA
jgi:hypothetical protein